MGFWDRYQWPLLGILAVALGIFALVQVIRRSLNRRLQFGKKKSNHLELRTTVDEILKDQPVTPANDFEIINRNGRE